MRHTTLALLLILSNMACAQNSVNSCEYSKGYVPQKAINNDNIKSYSWHERTASRGSETITSLNINYLNGDFAIIEHRYCSMYNFKISYFVADRKRLPTKTEAANLVNRFFTDHSMKKITFKPSFEKVLAENLEDYEISINENLETSLTITKFDGGHPYRRIINLYVGIGGQD